MNRTCIVLKNDIKDLADEAITIMKESGRIQAGTPSDYFSISPLGSDTGWIVTYHHPDILNYVSPEEIMRVRKYAFPEEFDDRDPTIGLFGREKRRKVAETLKIIHVEDKRKDR